MIGWRRVCSHGTLAATQHRVYQSGLTTTYVPMDSEHVTRQIRNKSTVDKLDRSMASMAAELVRNTCFTSCKYNVTPYFQTRIITALLYADKYSVTFHAVQCFWASRILCLLKRVKKEKYYPHL